MQIIKHYHVEETLQRSIVLHNGVEMRRLVRYVYPEGELMPTLPPSPALWQDKRQSGEWKTVSEPGRYERLFIQALIDAARANGSLPQAK